MVAFLGILKHNWFKCRQQMKPVEWVWHCLLCAAPSWLISQLDHMGMMTQKVPSAVETATPRPNTISLEPLESFDVPEDFLDAAFITDARLVSAEVFWMIWASD